MLSFTLGGLGMHRRLVWICSSGFRQACQTVWFWGGWGWLVHLASVGLALVWLCVCEPGVYMGVCVSVQVSVWPCVLCERWRGCVWLCVHLCVFGSV